MFTSTGGEDAVVLLCTEDEAWLIRSVIGPLTISTEGVTVWMEIDPFGWGEGEDGASEELAGILCQHPHDGQKR